MINEIFAEEWTIQHILLVLIINTQSWMKVQKYGLLRHFIVKIHIVYFSLAPLFQVYHILGPVDLWSTYDQGMYLITFILGMICISLMSSC